MRTSSLGAMTLTTTTFSIMTLETLSCDAECLIFYCYGVSLLSIFIQIVDMLSNVLPLPLSPNLFFSEL